jgi:phytoene dehydrogenase-like protein
MKTVIVIGAGVGGIASAARLVRLGYRVPVPEKTARPGGRTSTIEAQGLFFDTGPSLLRMLEPCAETYAALGQHREERLDRARIDPTDRVHFHDGSHLDLSGDLEGTRHQLEALEPGAFDGFLQFVARGYRHHTVSLERFAGRNSGTWTEFFHPANAPLPLPLHALPKHYVHTAKYFRGPRLRAAARWTERALGHPVDHTWVPIGAVPQIPRVGALVV